jgi:hypothetical protein
MKYSSRFWLYGPFVLLLLFATGVCANWYVVSSALEQKLAKLNGRQAIPGVTLRYSKPEMGGFPFRVDAVFRDFRATVKTKNGAIEYRAENLALHRLSYGSQTIFEAAGKQTLSWIDDKGERRAFTFVPGRLQASAADDKQGLARFDLDIIGIASSALKGQRFQFHIRRNPSLPQLDIVVKSNDLRPPGELQSILDGWLKGENYEAAVTKGDSFDALRSGTMSWIDAQARWHAAGGEVRVSR